SRPRAAIACSFSRSTTAPGSSSARSFPKPTDAPWASCPASARSWRKAASRRRLGPSPSTPGGWSGTAGAEGLDDVGRAAGGARGIAPDESSLGEVGTQDRRGDGAVALAMAARGALAIVLAKNARQLSEPVPRIAQLGERPSHARVIGIVRLAVRERVPSLSQRLPAQRIVVVRGDARRSRL